MIYIYAGTLTEDENGFTFIYDAGFLRYPAGHLKNFSLYDTGMGYSLTPAYHLLSTVIVMPEDTEELAGGQWQGNREHRLEIPTFHH